MKITSPRSFNILGIVAAVLMLPLFSYGSALLLERQIGAVVDRQSSLVEAPLPEQTQLSSDLKARIADAIDRAESPSQQGEVATNSR